MLAHVLALGAFAPPSRIALASVGPARAPRPACAATAEASMRKVVVGYALASAALCTSAVQADALGAAVRLSAAGAATLDFAPTAANQLASSSAALASSAPDGPTPLGVRWALLVRGKVLAEFAGFALMLTRRGTSWACAAVGVAMCGHLAFWLLGAARARHDDTGEPAPVPPPVARTIRTADAALLAAAAAGAAAPARGVRSAGAAIVALALATVSLEAALGKLRARLAPSASSSA